MVFESEGESGMEIVEVYEPKVDKSGVGDKVKFAKYSSGPMRLAVLARKK